MAEGRWFVGGMKRSLSRRIGRRTAASMVLVLLCGATVAGELPAPDPSAFRDYWYKGKAELTRYSLSQARYGELHSGHAVLIFVTEDFLTDRQVKHEFGDSHDVTSVLKLNSVRQFYTGIYPYCLMTSVFTPVDVSAWGNSLKVSFSSQEWCGQTYMQLNLRNDRYEGLLRSYFQKEGDRELTVGRTFLEDEVWTRIRVAPHTLPLGDITVIPGLQFARLRHIEIEPSPAHATIAEVADSSLSAQPFHAYTLHYGELRRTLSVFFEKPFPHAILGWEERYPSGAGAGARVLTTRAVRSNTLFTDYWNRNAVADSTYRKELGL